MAYVRVLRTYRFIDKDPVIDEVRTVLQDEGLIKKLNIVADLAGLSVTTPRNWFDGNTKKPQNASIMAVMTSLGYQREWKKSRKVDLDKELKLARDWLKREKAKADNAKANAKKKK